MDSVKIVRYEWRGTLVRGVVEHAAEEGNRHFAEAVLDDAQQHVPYDLGTLSDTGSVEQGRNALGQFGSTHFVSYDTGYAVRLHEHPEYHFQGQGEGKWLEKAVQRHQGSVRETAPPLMKVLGMP